MSDNPEQTPIKKPIYKRWWFIALGVFVILVAAFGSEGDDEEPAPSPTATAAPASTAATAPSTTTSVSSSTTQPTTTTTIPPSWESFAVEGSGDDVIDFSIPNDDPAVIEFTHSGSSNFAVISYTAGGERIDLLVNTIGSYSGARPVNFLVGEEVGELEISADGPWTATARPLSEMPVLNETLEGSGDQVVLYASTESRLTLTHTGDSNFAVIAWSSTDRDLLVNEIGAYEGTVRIDPAAFVIEIQADGAWTLVTG